MKTLYKKLTAVVLTAAMLFGLGGCGSSGGDGKISVRVAYFPNITHSQALVMKNQKTLENKWGDSCEVTWTSFNAGPAEMEAIFAGEIDLGYIGPVPALSANAKSNGEVKIISNSTDAGAVLLKRKDSGIDSVADLAGKKVAVPQLGNTQHLCLLKILADNNLKTTDQGGDVTVSASANADIVNLIDNKSVDAALVPEPWGTTIEKNGNAEVLLDYDEVIAGGNYPTAVVVVSEDFNKKHPDIVKDFIEAHEEATVYINGNKDAAISVVNSEIENATGKSLNEDVIKGAFERMTITSELNKDAIMEFGNISKEAGFIESVPEVEDVFTTAGN